MSKSTTTTPTGSNRTGTATSRNQHTSDQELQPTQDLVDYLKDYARAKPDVAALWCFGIGFVVGWKLKPW